MASVEMRADLSTLIDALVAGNTDQIIALTRDMTQHDHSADVLIGRIGLIAANADPDGHILLTLDAAAMLCRYVHTIPQPLEGEVRGNERATPLFAQAMLFAAPAVRASNNAQTTYPQPFYPSGLGEKGTVSEAMREAVEGNDPVRVERLLLGLYGTGSDYRTMQVRAYDSIATTFQDAGHPLMMAVRGFQLLGTVEWGDRAPHIIHWLAPRLPLRPDATQPTWIKPVHEFALDPAHDMASVRTRLSAPKDQNALPLRRLVLSDADTTQICQAVYDAVMRREASPRAVGSVLALAAADVMSMVGDGDRELFIQVAHGLLFTAAVRVVFQQVQDIDVLPLLFTSAAYINELRKEVTAQHNTMPTQTAPASSAILGGGLIAPSQLETLTAQLQGQDFSGAVTTSQRYLKLNHDARSLFATIGLIAAQTDATTDQGHTLQIVQAASEEFLAWPHALSETSIDAFLQVAIRAAAFGKRDPRLANL